MARGKILSRFSPLEGWHTALDVPIKKKANKKRRVREPMPGLSAEEGGAGWQEKNIARASKHNILLGRQNMPKGRTGTLNQEHCRKKVRATGVSRGKSNNEAQTQVLNTKESFGCAQNHRKYLWQKRRRTEGYKKDEAPREGGLQQKKLY